MGLTGEDEPVEWGERGRKRDREFCDVFMEELRTKSEREALLATGRRLGWEWRVPTKKETTVIRPMKDSQILRRARKIRDREGSVEYMRSMFDAVGFTPVDGTRKIVEHMTTPTPQNPLGSLDAVKLYVKLTNEEASKKVQVDTRMMVAHRMIGDAPPATRVRVLKPKELGAP